jgi:hypothetical protein
MAEAKRDTLIERPDLGPECYTLVVKGDEIPVALADLPAHPRDPEKPPKPKG